jgi:hypothetical protein
MTKPKTLVLDVAKGVVRSGGQYKKWNNDFLFDVLNLIRHPEIHEKGD